MSESEHSPVIIGAGPAGLACAATLVEAGLRPIILDEAVRPGGQGTRRLASAVQPLARRLMGSKGVVETARREAAEDAILKACDWRPGNLIWGIFGDRLEILRDGRHEELKFSQLMISSGATDRIMALPGWTLPGVYSLGGAQVALKQHAALIGQSVVMAGSSPLLYLAAVQYARMGVRSLVVVDTVPRLNKMKAGIGMALTAPTTLLEGVSLLLELKRRGVRMVTGASPQRIVGHDRVEALEIQHADGCVERISCDAVAYGYGLRPETQLAELAGAQFRFDPTLRNWFPLIDEDGRAGPNLWLAGDCAQTGGRVAAAKSGRLAALSMLEARGNPALSAEMRALRRSVGRLRQFQLHMAKAFRWPHEMAGTLPDATIVCRCERVSAGEIRAAVGNIAGPVEVNRVKAITRCGMGRCQGRFCGQTLQELTATASGLPVADVGRMRAQAPVKPIPISASQSEVVHP
ncbi:NAD(P)/FAD-dependent oxidoreductase [Limoniibacter endophyticus]|uniref:FAD/NAD(P)-binding oxidoreductase n=1 Tax=Limoniibacter endophyticus TaxID=1565040 RepID=A0A8J3DQN5_9HYPH|nr:FAD/NAD(P)-binding oxidoreductase [Limoniibacter endophyticus]GHC72628.1 FAD/NAD(P)-binding oxidoreductase [Limoniibacter endophyticus]